MRVLVCGDRNWNSYITVFTTLQDLIRKRGGISVIIEGGCRGADLCAKRAAEALRIPVEEYPARWELYGRAAGPIRNQRMLDEGRPDIVLAFHKDLTQSKGTLDMLRKSYKRGCEILVIPKQQIPA